MNFKFSFTHTPDIFFGAGSLKKLPASIKKSGDFFMLIHGKSFDERDYAKNILNELSSSGLRYERIVVDSEPSPGLIAEVVSKYKESNLQSVVSIGGGSVIDAGKAISAMLTSEGEITDYLEGIGHKQPTGDKLPFIAVPTTAGTGSEMTKNAVITQLGKNGYKKSLRHDNFVPDVAIVDPKLTLSCPPMVTATSGLDALSQLIESYLSTHASPLTNALAMQGIWLMKKSLLAAYKNGEDLEARTDVAYATMLSGITLANAGLGVVHGFAQPLGSLFPVPHGVVCGRLMAVTNKITLDKIIRNNLDTSVLSKYSTLGNYILGKQFQNQMEAANSFIEWLQYLTIELKVPGLSEYNIQPSDFKKIISQTGLKYHPVILEEDELKTILMQSL